MKREEEIRYIFYTGGWDSTFRLIELSRMSIKIQPIYCIDDGRTSKDIEIERMKEIIEVLKKKEQTIAEFLPIQIINKKEINSNKEITEAYKIICEKVKLGSQYEWLSRLAKEYQGVELGIEKPSGEYSGCVDAIEQFGKLIYEDGSYRIDIENSSRECNLLFGNFSFPIINITELEMVEKVKEWGIYDDVVKKIWFCHSPKGGEPCGFCRPCQQKMECGMQMLLPVISQKRYHKYKKFKKIFGNKGAKLVLRYLRIMVYMLKSIKNKNI